MEEEVREVEVGVRDDERYKIICFLLVFFPPSFFKTEVVVVRSVVGRLDGLIDGMVTEYLLGQCGGGCTTHRCQGTYLKD
jgi:hypothetical protein